MRPAEDTGGMCTRANWLKALYLLDNCLHASALW